MIMQSIVIFVKKCLVKKKNHSKVRDHDHYIGKFRGAAHLICNLRYSTQIDIPVFFHNGTNYDFNLIITELAKEFRSEMRCIPLNTNKYMSCSIPIKKEIKQNDKNEEKKKVITYNLKFIDSARHMNRALSTLVDNLSEINKCNCEESKDKDLKIKVKEAQGKKVVCTMCKTCKSKETQLVSDLIKKFPCTYKLCNNNNNNNNNTDVTQLSDVFESFRSVCLREYQLDPSNFVSTPSLALEAMLKRTKVQIELITDIDMVLMTEKGIRGGLT